MSLDRGRSASTADLTPATGPPVDPGTGGRRREKGRREQTRPARDRHCIQHLEAWAHVKHKARPGIAGRREECGSNVLCPDDDQIRQEVIAGPPPEHVLIAPQDIPQAGSMPDLWIFWSSRPSDARAARSAATILWSLSVFRRGILGLTHSR